MPIKNQEDKKSTKRNGVKHNTRCIKVVISIGAHSYTLHDDQLSMVIGSDKVAFIDTGLKRSEILKALLFVNEEGGSLLKKHYVILTHGHLDHSYSAFIYKMLFKEYSIICAHSRSSYEVDKKLEDGETLDLGDLELEIICTPGHSFDLDDISIYVKEDKVLFCGDVCQPQGLSFEKADWPSPVPFFCWLNQYKASIEKLLQFDFEVLQGGHKATYYQNEGIKALKITLEVVNFMEELAKKLTEEHPNQSVETIASWIYDTVAYKRNFDARIAEARKVSGDYHRYDFPGIKAIIGRFRK